MNDLSALSLFLGDSVFAERLSFGLPIVGNCAVTGKQAGRKVLVETERLYDARPGSWSRRQKPHRPASHGAVIRKTLRASPGRRPASERSLHHPELLSAFTTTTTLMRLAVQRLQQTRPYPTELHHVAAAQNIPTRILTLGARVLHPSTSVFDRSPDPVPRPSHRVAVASHALFIPSATAIHDIGHGLTYYSAWAHYERAPAHETEHIKNSSRHH